LTSGCRFSRALARCSREGRGFGRGPNVDAAWAGSVVQSDAVVGAARGDTGGSRRVFRPGRGRPVETSGGCGRAKRGRWSTAESRSSDGSRGSATAGLALRHLPRRRSDPAGLRSHSIRMLQRVAPKRVVTSRVSGGNIVSTSVSSANPYLRRVFVDSRSRVGWRRTERSGLPSHGVRPEVTEHAVRGGLRRAERVIVDGDIRDARSADRQPSRHVESVAGSSPAYL
jgi:hypothetical protein